jgi:hypothetical protein
MTGISGLRSVRRILVKRMVLAVSINKKEKPCVNFDEATRFDRPLAEKVQINPQTNKLRPLSPITLNRDLPDQAAKEIRVLNKFCGISKNCASREKLGLTNAPALLY